VSFSVATRSVVPASTGSAYTRPSRVAELHSRLMDWNAGSLVSFPVRALSR